MNDTQFANFIKNKGYRTSNQFNNDPEKLKRLIKFVKALPVQKQSFQIIENLLKFYRTPFFIACDSFYERLVKTDNKIVSEFEENIKQIANFVKNYLEEYELEELKFFYFLGISKKKRKLPDKSDNEKEFIKYMQRLGKNIKTLKASMSQMKPQKLQNEINVILSDGLERKLNIFQQNYQKHFKNEADKIYKQHRKQFEEITTIEQNKALEQKPEYESQKKTFICCRTFFFDQQIIKQPQNLVLEYKNYYFPFGDAQIKILKKTICGFLNTNGGTILLGIQQNVDNKKRKVIGNQLNEADKQNFLFFLRKDIVDSISPDILTNKMYWVNFVPVKQKSPPYHYISGRYVTKITIKYGLRNEIYSYRSEDKDNFAFRTENQIIHRQGRQILNAYRQRLKNPLPIPVPVHEGPCAVPQQGRPITTQERVKKEQEYLIENNFNSPQKRKYKQKDAVDFIVVDITQKDLTKQFNSLNLGNHVMINYDSKQKACFVKVLEHQKRESIISALITMYENKQCEFYETQRGIQINKQQNLVDKLIDELSYNNFKFSYNKNKNVIEFKTTQQAIEAFLILRHMSHKINFIGV